jgi:hypothetical protein
MNERIDQIYHQVIHEACADPLYRFAELVRHDERLKCSEDYLADCVAAVEAARLEEREACAKLCAEIGQTMNGYGCAANIRGRTE